MTEENVSTWRKTLFIYPPDHYKKTHFVAVSLVSGRTEPTHMVRPCSKNGRRKIAQDIFEVDAKTNESTRKTKEKLDGRNKEDHERNKPK
jgi:hypothetical protein